MLLKSIVWAQSAFASLDTRDEEGQTLVEYALILVLVAVLLVVSLGLLKQDIIDAFKKVTDAL